MKDRLYKLIVIILGGIFITILLGTSPIWVIIWVFTGFNPIEFIQRKVNPEYYKKMDQLRKETAEAYEELDRLKLEVEEQERIKRELDRIKNSN